ncbi:MAG: hypothetical protein FJ125_01645 [Deltaproteobacteria bacterium]|nr:hypothetical protein [Deltaproteobacteria bacterium]
MRRMRGLALLLATLLAVAWACGSGEKERAARTPAADATVPDGGGETDAAPGDAAAVADGEGGPDDAGPGAHDGPALGDGGAGADDGGATDGALTADTGRDAGPQPVPPFPRGLPATERLGEPHGYRLARAIIHIHSIFSHDACDGHPVVAGQPDEECLQDLRRALCTDRIDFAMMTEHYDLMARTLDFDLLFLQRDGDRWVDEGGRHSANAVRCPDGHTPLVMPGLEGGDGQVSPIGITGHPVDGTPEQIEAAYKDVSPEGVGRMRAHDAVPVAIHIEGQDTEWLATTDLDAVEIGNLHVLVAPNYRTELGLDPGKPALAFADYLMHPADHPPPDLVFLEFHQRLPLYHEKWDALLARRMIAGFAGNDVHRNVLPALLGDGDRPDSYRRMMKYYVNHLLVRDKTPAEARTALARGRLYMVFEVLGSPVGFDFWAERANDGEVRVMGEVADSGGDPSRVRLRATRPRALLSDAPTAVPVSLRLFRVTAAGSELVAETDGELDLPAPGPGRYRVELELTPLHLGPYLVGHEELMRPYPWIYANPIEVR